MLQTGSNLRPDSLHHQHPHYDHDDHADGEGDVEAGQCGRAGAVAFFTEVGIEDITVDAVVVGEVELAQSLGKEQEQYSADNDGGTCGVEIRYRDVLVCDESRDVCGREDGGHYDARKTAADEAEDRTPDVFDVLAEDAEPPAGD